MENLLLDALVEVVADRTHEHALREAGNLARRNERVHLCVDGGGDVLTVDGDRLPFLQHLAETLRKRLGGLAHHLPGEDVADGVHHHLCFLVAIVTHQLREILKAQTHRHLVAACRGDEVVQSLEIDGGQLVDDDRRFQHPLLVDEFHDAGVIQSECRTVNVLAVGIVAHTENLRFFGVVDVERELAVRHHPVELWRNHA